MAAPVTTAWYNLARYGHTARPGEDLEVDGVNLSTVTAVTVGGVAQSFTIGDDTYLTIHADNALRSGPVIVTNPDGSTTAPTDCARQYAGPWIQPPDAAAQDLSDKHNGNAYGSLISNPTQPDFAGSPVNGPYATLEYGVEETFGTPGSWDWSMQSAAYALLGTGFGRDVHTMPPLDSSVLHALVLATPHAVDAENEAAAGTHVGDVQVAFQAGIETGRYSEDTTGRTLAEDLWLTGLEFRRLAPADWYFGGISGHKAALTGDVWPSVAALTAMPLDATEDVLAPGASLALATVGATGTTDNYADLVQGTYPDPGDPVTVAWADYAPGIAWAVTFGALIDGAPIAPPYLNTPDLSGYAAWTKVLGGQVAILGTWTYRPPRYRLWYDQPVGQPPLRQLQRGDSLAGGAPRQLQTPSASGRQGPGRVI